MLNFDSKTSVGFVNCLWALLALILVIVWWCTQIAQLLVFGAPLWLCSYVIVALFVGRTHLFDEDGDPTDNGEN